MLTYTHAPQITDAYIGEVWERLPPALRSTFFLADPTLSQKLRCEVTVVSETFQYTGSFKFRAAYNLLASIPQQHVITASSGNFGQAVAYASKLLGKTCTVVMPTTSAQVKIEAVRAYGGSVDLVDVRKVSRAERVAQLMQQRPDAFQAPAYDDYRVVAGNSTLGMEIFAALDPDVILVPVGGGGLSSGLVLARDYLQKETEILGAEPLLGNDAAHSLRLGTLISNTDEPATVADGARTLSLGQLNWEILRQGMKDILEVPDAAILAGLRHSFRYLNLKVEPTGALSLGALLSAPGRFEGKRVCCVVSGGNVDPQHYAQYLSAE